MILLLLKFCDELIHGLDLVVIVNDLYVTDLLFLLWRGIHRKSLSLSLRGFGSTMKWHSQVQLLTLRLSIVLLVKCEKVLLMELKKVLSGRQDNQ